MKHRHHIWIILLFTLTGLSCTDAEVLPDIEQHIAGPADVDVSEDGQYFYVLNTNFDHNYQSGSILILDETGAKQGAVKIDSLGRSMMVAGNRMLVAFDKKDPDSSSKVELYDLTDPLQPVLKKTFPLDCSPINAVARPGYAHFAVSCLGGHLYVGTFGADLSESTLNLVRELPLNRRALYIDPTRELLLAFTTDMARQEASDLKAKDEKSFTDETETAVANEIPDDFESTKRARRRLSQRYVYQFTVYDIAKERSEGFKLRRTSDRDDQVVQGEDRWIYFTLNNFDGTPDSDEGVRDPSTRNYRTNFWAVKPDATDPNRFYLSHRGGSASENANNIVRVSIIGDLKPTAATAETDCGTGFRYEVGNCVPFTNRVLSFERVYGFNGEVDSLSYPGDFVIQPVQGQDVLLVNHFRDLVYWKPDQRRFSIAAKTLDQGEGWLSEIKSTDHRQSYLEVAMNARGKALSCSFYGNNVLLLDVKPGTAITLEKQID